MSVVLLPVSSSNRLQEGVGEADGQGPWWVKWGSDIWRLTSDLNGWICWWLAAGSSPRRDYTQKGAGLTSGFPPDGAMSRGGSTPRRGTGSCDGGCEKVADYCS
ncbi:hypothetical protein GCM10009753_44930 [Streptantibioticus ferralitis]